MIFMCESITLPLQPVLTKVMLRNTKRNGAQDAAMQRQQCRDHNPLPLRENPSSRRSYMDHLMARQA